MAIYTTDNINQEKINEVFGNINLALENFISSIYDSDTPLFKISVEEVPNDILKIFTMVRNKIENSDLNDKEKATAWAIVSREIITNLCSLDLENLRLYF